MISQKERSPTTRAQPARRSRRRALALVEVLAVWGGLILLLRGGATWWPAFDAWQRSVFGAPLATEVLLMFALPIAAIALARRSPRRYGLVLRPAWPSVRLAGQAFSVIGPFLPVFSLLMWLGWPFNAWRGALVLVAVFLVSFALVVRVTAGQDLPGKREGGGRRDTGALLLVLAAGAGVVAWAWPEAKVLARAVWFFLLVGFGEELFFRGYVQSRLNAAFGRPWRLGGARVGVGLLLATVIFGATHGLASPGTSTPAWALWTTTSGLTFGYLREKGGSILACAIAHGLFDLPLAFFGG